MKRQQQRASTPHSTLWLSSSLWTVLVISTALLFLNYHLYLSSKQIRKKLSLRKIKDTNFVEFPSNLKANQVQFVETQKASFIVLQATCFEGYDLSLTNNNPTSHDVCFSDCLAWNSDITKAKKCVGWTKGKGYFDNQSQKIYSEICSLKSEVDLSNSFNSSECSSAVLLKSVQKLLILDEELKEDYYEPSHSDSHLKDDEIRDYYYSTVT